MGNRISVCKQYHIFKKNIGLSIDFQPPPMV